eukprot:TRINITY_DN14937_c0_g1_i1.p1 TRINITY_DN14937_c0_g1~~TRINITY_DN14937_c0_g1_i1.p1  ORF type:complete len:399 (-),score=78.51 TRINITY_DN14937_c0_g1_i1:127-1293(-)
MPETCNFLFISPHFPPEYFNFCTTLVKAGARVYGIGDAPYQELRKELKSALTEYYKVGSLNNYDEVYRGVAHLISKYGRMNKIESHNEFWLEMDAHLREDFNVPGARPREVRDAKSKAKMKEKYIAAGLRVAKGSIVKTREEAVAFCQETGFPVVAKPDKGVGATETYKINKIEELDQIDFNTVYIMEEFITGDIISYDGLVGKDGKILFRTCHKYMNPVLKIVTEKTPAAHYNYREVPKELDEYGRKTVEIFKLNEQFFHMEFFQRPDGAIVCLEANLRPPGAYILDLMNFSINGDLYQAYANCLVNHVNEFPHDVQYSALFVGRRNVFKYVHTPEEIRLKYKDQLLFDKPMEKSAYSLLCDHFYFFRSPSGDQIREIFDFVDARKE